MLFVIAIHISRAVFGSSERCCWFEMLLWQEPQRGQDVQHKSVHRNRARSIEMLVFQAWPGMQQNVPL